MGLGYEVQSSGVTFAIKRGKRFVEKRLQPGDVIPPEDWEKLDRLVRDAWLSQGLVVPASPISPSELLARIERLTERVAALEKGGA